MAYTIHSYRIGSQPLGVGMAYGQGPEDPRQWQTQPGWQPQYQQQYQQPYDQPPGMYGPPPPKKSNTPLILLIVGAVLLFLFGGCAVLFVAVGQSPTIVTTSAPEVSRAGEQPAEAPRDEPTQPPVAESADASGEATPAQAVGGTISLQGRDPDLQVDVTVTKVIDNATPANQFLKPETGNRFVAIELRLTNKGQAVYSDAPSNGAYLIDVEGQQYRSTHADVREGVSLSGSTTISVGDSRKGVLIYEIPSGTKPAKFQFALNSGFADQKGEWTIG